MKMRRVLRHKDSGKPKARLVIIGYHDPRVGSEVRTEALVASRRGTSLFFMATAHNQFFIEKEDVKKAFLQGTFDDKTNGELAAEPVLELRKALNLRADEIVVLTKVCYGVIDAPRRWWKSLVQDTQQLGWRSCRHEPCLMTWHFCGRLKGLVCFHVDNVMISRPKGDPEFKRMLDKVKRLCEWGEWEQHEFDQCGCRIRQATDKSQDQSHHDVCTPTQAHVRNFLSGRTHNIDGKTWRAELVRKTIHDSIVSTTESHRHVENSHRTKSQRCESTRATGSL